MSGLQIPHLHTDSHWEQNSKTTGTSDTLLGEGLPEGNAGSCPARSPAERYCSSVLLWKRPTSAAKLPQNPRLAPELQSFALQIAAGLEFFLQR